MRSRRTAPRVAMMVVLLFTSAARPNGEAEGLRDGQQPPPPASVSPQSVASSLDEATRLQQEADVHVGASQLKEAGEKTEQALAIRRQHLGDMHPDVAYSLSQLGTIAYGQGQYDRAETLISDALKIREATLGPNHLDVAESLDNLASMLLIRGDYVRPDPLYQRALAIYEKTLESSPTPSPEVQALIAGVLNNLALLNSRRGDYAQAESQYLKALAISEGTRGPDDPSVAGTLADLGGVYYLSGQYRESGAGPAASARHPGKAQ